MKSKINSKKIKKVILVSGGFDPIHIGHVRMFKEAKKLGDYLVVLVNNDNWLQFKKGYNFIHQRDRKEIIESFSYVDKVILTTHTRNTKDISVCKDIKKIKPHIFANGGDRKSYNIPEYSLCEELGIQMVFNVGKGGKVRSSSELLKEYAQQKHDSKKN